MIDTYEMQKQLISVGFSDDEAAAVTSVVRQVQDLDLSPPVATPDLSAYLTKAEFDAAMSEFVTKAELKAALSDIATRADLQAMISNCKVSIIKWMVGISIVQTLFIVAMIRLML